MGDMSKDLIGGMGQYLDQTDSEREFRVPGIYALSSLVAEICQRAGLPDSAYNVARLEGNVAGFMFDSDHPAFTAIRELAKVYYFDPSNHDGKLWFVPRGGDVVMTVPEEEVLESVEEEDEQQKRRDSLSIPRVLNLSYYDVDGGTQTDMQSSDRSVDTRSTGESGASTPVILTTDDAKKLAVISHKVMIEEQRGEVHLSLPDSYLALAVGDLVEYRGQRLRIFEVEIDDGFQAYKLIHDRASAYRSDAKGLPPVQGKPPAKTVPGLTRMELIDCKPLTDRDDFLGYYFAATGDSRAWKGAVVELSRDGGETYEDGAAVDYDTVIGDLVTSLGAHPRDYPDAVHTFRVAMLTPYVDLHSATLKELMNRKNLAIVGEELVSIGSVDEVEPGVWEFATLLRGRKGSAIAEHPVGTRFVWLDRSWLAYIGAESYDIGQTLTFRATAYGSSEPSITTLDFSAQSQTERAVAYLTAERLGNGNVAIAWQGVGRLGGRTSVTHGAYFDGYQVEVDGVVTRTQDTQLTTAIPAGPTLIRVAQRNKFTGSGPFTEVTV